MLIGDAVRSAEVWTRLINPKTLGGRDRGGTATDHHRPAGSPAQAPFQGLGERYEVRRLRSRLWAFWLPDVNQLAIVFVLLSGRIGPVEVVGPWPRPRI